MGGKPDPAKVKEEQSKKDYYFDPFTFDEHLPWYARHEPTIKMLKAAEGESAIAPHPLEAFITVDKAKAFMAAVSIQALPSWVLQLAPMALIRSRAGVKDF
jgi:hypothetical protein